MSFVIDDSLVKSAQKGDKDAAERLIVENSGLIWSVARHYFGRGLDSDDLYQLGCVGFIKAIKSYDESYGTRFSTYAVPKMAGEIRRFLRDDGSIKVSRTLKERAAAIYAAKNELEQKLGREPKLSELSERTGFTPEEIASAETAVASTQSLEYESGEDGFALKDILSDSTQEEKLLEYVALREGIEALPPKEREVIKLRFYRGLTQQNTARIMQVSQVQISRLERKALGKLKSYLE